MLPGITVFAPLESLFQGNQTQIDLGGYVVNQTIYNNGSLNASAPFTSLNGTPLSITSDSNYTMRVGNATVLESNILLSNGVLHIIDSLLPSNQTQA